MSRRRKKLENRDILARRGAELERKPDKRSGKLASSWKRTGGRGSIRPG